MSTISRQCYCLQFLEKVETEHFYFLCAFCEYRVEILMRTPFYATQVARQYPG